MRKIAVMLAALIAVSAPSLAEAKGKKAKPAPKQTVQEDPNARFGHAVGDLLTSLSQPPAAAKAEKGKQAKAKSAKTAKKG